MNTIYAKIRRGEFLFTLQDIKGFFDKVSKTDECWLWAGYKDEKGYGRISIRSTSSILTHIVSYLLHKGPIPDDLHVCHSCDNPSCVNPNHLWLGTHLQNMRDRNNKGRCGESGRKGVNINFAKLDDSKVIEIRKSVRLGASQKEMAQRFSVGVSTISSIITNRTWKHLKI